MRRRLLPALAAALLTTAPAAAGAQEGGLDPASLTAPLEESWPTYSGDYTGRRYSKLTQVNTETVLHLTLAWTVELNTGMPPLTGPGAPDFIGGASSGEFTIGSQRIKGAILQVGDLLYVTAPDHVWALDARDGTERWHYFWKTRGGPHIGNRGAAIWRDSLFFETVDNYLVSLDLRTGEERWHTEIASFEEQYFSTMAPIVVGDHLLVGTGNDLDAPGFLQSFDPATGERQWIMKPGDPGLETWPSLDAASHGGGQVWVPGVYDPETNYYIFGTGNPTPGYTGVARRGDNLFTCTLIAVDVATGEMAWYFQTSPHDTHDWDSAQTPILIDGVIDGEPRKLVSTAARNGYFFTVDRVTGEHIATSRYGATANWASHVRESGSPNPDPRKEAIIPGALVSPVEGGVTNWQPPAFNPDTGLFYTQENNGFNLLYLTDPDPRGSMGLGGKDRVVVGSGGNAFSAIDYRTGDIVWRHAWPPGGGGGAGVLTTAGGVVFTGDGSGNFVAFDAADGDLLWHTRIGNISNAPQTHLLDGRQYVLVAVGQRLFAFVMY
ncbi:MAG: acido-empty-quinoprotein group A [Acidobacteria bacterium]|nr:acido-empty-quinoprotein group A [Acidobacteriota bacterium]